MLELDPVSVILGAGPMGGIVVWLLIELREMRKKLVAVIEDNARASQQLAVVIDRMTEAQKYRALMDKELADEIRGFKAALIQVKLKRD